MRPKLHCCSYIPYFSVISNYSVNMITLYVDNPLIVQSIVKAIHLLKLELSKLFEVKNYREAQICHALEP